MRSQGMTVQQFRDTMAVDKKVQDGKLRLILLRWVDGWKGWWAGRRAGGGSGSERQRCEAEHALPTACTPPSAAGARWATA